MKIRNLIVPILGLGIPALANTSYFTGTGANTAYNNAVVAASLSPNGPYTFSGANIINSNTEYADPTGVDFFAFQNNNSASPGSALTFGISGTTLTTLSGTGSIEITLPANIFAVGFTLTSNGLSQLCGNVDSTDSGCSNPALIANSSDTEFIGIVSTTAISTIWIGRNVGGPPYIVNFSDATGSTTPEGRSLLLLGSGLVLIGLLKRRQRGAGRSAQCSPEELRP
jgi:hypothetical protein